ncbi:MAG: Mrp/NBP35 family ATP-binding protein [Acholeplasmataceae bacterium]|nr:Mrp/NBP35 family ATP-binding protein [Acholeplasmataceae bacterium]
MNEEKNMLTEEERKQKKAAMLVSSHLKSNIKSIIGVTSGKGGVGKSTITSLFASHYQKMGYKVGIIDADITGPSIPKAFDLHKRIGGSNEGWYPEETLSGIKVISINLMLENETDPVLWRGPLLSNMVKKFYTDVIWGDIDVLFVDFPPGTSDVAITMFQSIPLTGVVVVTSPQDLVSMIVDKAIHMAEKMQIPVLGLIENMSYFECPSCHETYEIFGKSKIMEIAKTHHVPLLAQLPINPQVANFYDDGKIEKIELDAIYQTLSTIIDHKID